MSFEFNQFSLDNGIKRQLTTPYTPQQNGVVERNNRTVMNMVKKKILRSLLKIWRPKATTIQEGKDLNKLQLEDLMSSYKAHGLELNKQ